MSALRPRFSPENERSKACRRNDVDGAVMVEVDRNKIRTCSRFVVDQFGNKTRSAWGVGIAHRFVDIQDRLSKRIGVKKSVYVRQVTFAHDEVLDAIAVHIRKGGSVGFAEDDA